MAESSNEATGFKPIFNGLNLDDWSFQRTTNPTGRLEAAYRPQRQGRGSLDRVL